MRSETSFRRILAISALVWAAALAWYYALSVEPKFWHPSVGPNSAQGSPQTVNEAQPCGG